MPTLGPPELLIILVIVMLIFGAGKLSDIGKSLGQGIREFRHSVQEDPAAPTQVTAAPPAPAVTTSAPVATMAPAAPVTAVAAKCAGCGTDLLAGARFCPSCGKAIAS